MTRPVWTAKAIPARIPGWERAARPVLETHMAQPITWGTSDCLSVPIDLCQAMTGVSVLSAHLRRYRTELGAYKLLAKLGFADVEEALNAAFTRTAVAMARRFDAGVVERLDEAGRPVLATVIVIEGGQAIGRDHAGIVLVPVLSLRSTFAIGAR